MTELVVRRARGADDVETVAKMWVRAAERLAAKGSDQWQYPVKVHNINAAVAAGTCWLVHTDGQVAGTITVDQQADPTYWLPEDDPTNALYVHRMIIEPALQGQNAGVALLDWVAETAIAQGFHWVRLDAWRSNHGLRRYYEHLGFQLVRVAEDDPTGSGACYQRSSDIRLNRGPRITEAT